MPRELLQEALGSTPEVDLSGARFEPDPELETLLLKVEDLSESMRQLELSREDFGWSLLGGGDKDQFQRSSLTKHAQLCRVFAVANPLVKRALALRAAYVFGQGVGTIAKGEKVNAVVQDWLDDPEVREAFAGAEAQRRNELALGTEGNVFISMFTDPLTGRVRPRVVPFDEITEVVTDPQDSMTVQYFRRDFSVANELGNSTARTEYHPALNFRPRTRQKRYGDSATELGKPIIWDAPIYQVKVNALPGWDFGIGDAFAALPWARMYKEFLENWALYMDALSKIAYQRVDASGKNSARSARSALETMAAIRPGSSVDATDGTKLEAVSKSGATLDADSGRQLAAMVGTSFGIPVTMLLADPGQTGARAVAETLDTPTRLEMESRQEVWREARRQLLNYVIDQAVIAPAGALRGQGRIRWDRDQLIVTMNNTEDKTLVTTFPSLEKVSVDVLVDALVAAAEYLPPRLLTERIMRAIGVSDVDEWLDKMYDEDGNPKNDPAVNAGSAAARTLRQGGNPAEFV